MNQPPPGPATGASEAPRTRPLASADWGVEAAGGIVRRMLQSADDVLFELSGKTSSEDQRRNFFDSMRLLRKSGTSLLKSFEAALRPGASNQTSTATSMPLKLSLRNDDEVEEEITVANITSRIEGLAQNGLWEFGLRMENIPGASGLRQRLEILRPKAIIKAFRDGLQPLGFELEIRLILFKLFERQLLTDARAFYQTLNDQLEAEGFSSEAVAIKRQASAPQHKAGSANPESVGATAAAGPPAPAYSFAPALMQSLSQWQTPAQWGMAALDSVIGASASSAMSGGGGQMLQTAGLQRLSLVSQLLEETGRTLPAQEMDTLRRLILPIVKIALADTSFFANPAHPARSLISGLESLGADSSEKRAPRLAQTEAALQELLNHYAPPGQVDPLDGPALIQFLASLRSPRGDTSARMTAARAAAHEQVKATGSGLDLPVGLGPFLNEIWMPMVTAISLRFGVGTPEWKRSAELLQRVFGECRWATDNAEPEVVEAIVEDVSGEMVAMGVPDKLVGHATKLLRKGLAQPEHAQRRLDLETFGSRERPAVEAGSSQLPRRRTDSPAEAVAVSGADSQIDWRAAIPVGAWFRVFERKTERTLWMSADVFYPEAAQLSFTGFDPEVRVVVTKTDFLEDLKTGRAEAVNATPAQAEAISRLTATAT